MSEQELHRTTPDRPLPDISAHNDKHTAGNQVCCFNIDICQ